MIGWKLFEWEQIKCSKLGLFLRYAGAFNIFTFFNVHLFYIMSIYSLIVGIGSQSDKSETWHNHMTIDQQWKYFLIFFRSAYFVMLLTISEQLWRYRPFFNRMWLNLLFCIVLFLAVIAILTIWWVSLKLDDRIFKYFVFCNCTFCSQKSCSVRT